MQLGREEAPRMHHACSVDKLNYTNLHYQLNLRERGGRLLPDIAFMLPNWVSNNCRKNAKEIGRQPKRETNGKEKTEMNKRNTSFESRASLISLRPVFRFS